MGSWSDKKKIDYIVYSNFAFALPILVSLVAWQKCAISGYDCATLVIVFLATGIMSGAWHKCKETIRFSGDRSNPKCNVNELLNVDWAITEDVYIPNTVSKLRDLVISNVSITAAIALMFKEKNFRHFLPIFSFVYYMFFLGYENAKHITAYLEIAPHAMMLLYLIYTKLKYGTNMAQIVCLVLAVIVLAAAVYFKKQVNSFEENDYSIHHSLWHLGAGVAPALVILSSMFKYTQIKWY